jgi:hypothetical protein
MHNGKRRAFCALSELRKTNPSPTIGKDCLREQEQSSMMTMCRGLRLLRTAFATSLKPG